MKSLEVQFTEVIGEMNESQQERFYQKRDQLKESTGSMPSLETQLHIAKTVTERTSVKRNNGRVQESGSDVAISPADAILYEALKLTPAEIAKITGSGPAELNEKERFQYKFGLGIGLSEADALKLAKKDI